MLKSAYVRVMVIVGVALIMSTGGLAMIVAGGAAGTVQNKGSAPDVAVYGLGESSGLVVNEIESMGFGTVVSWESLGNPIVAHNLFVTDQALAALGSNEKLVLAKYVYFDGGSVIVLGQGGAIREVLGIASGSSLSISQRTTETVMNGNQSVETEVSPLTEMSAPTPAMYAVSANPNGGFNQFYYYFESTELKGAIGQALKWCQTSHRALSADAETSIALTDKYNSASGSKTASIMATGDTNPPSPPWINYATTDYGVSDSVLYLWVQVNWWRLNDINLAKDYYCVEFITTTQSVNYVYSPTKRPNAVGPYVDYRTNTLDPGYFDDIFHTGRVHEYQPTNYPDDGKTYSYTVGADLTNQGGGISASFSKSWYQPGASISAVLDTSSIPPRWVQWTEQLRGGNYGLFGDSPAERSHVAMTTTHDIIVDESGGTATPNTPNGMKTFIPVTVVMKKDVSISRAWSLSATWTTQYWVYNLANPSSNFVTLDPFGTLDSYGHPVTGVSTLLAPSNGATNVPLTTTLSWSPATGSDYWYVRVWNPNNGWSASAYTSTPSWTVTLPSSSGLNWCVSSRSTINAAYVWSYATPTWVFTTAPWTGVATLTYPANGATGISLNPTLTWTGPAGANYYKIYIYSGSWSTTLYSSTSSLAISLSPSATWYWEVASSPDGGATYGPWTAVWSFTTWSNGVATLTNPANGATGVPTNPTLRWIGPTGANYYAIYISSGGWSATRYSSTPYWAGTYDPYATWYWKVASSPDGGASYGPWSATWSFTTGSGPWTGVATLTYPANGATGISLNPTLTWTGPAGANYYAIFISSGGWNVTRYSSTPYWTGSFDPSTTWNWRVASSPDGGSTYGPWSATWYFTTGAPPVYYTLTVSAPSGSTDPAAGTYSYVAGTQVTCTAYDYVSGRYYYMFKYWRVDGVSQGTYVNPITVTMNSAHTVSPVYQRTLYQ